MAKIGGVIREWQGQSAKEIIGIMKSAGNINKAIDESIGSADDLKNKSIPYELASKIIEYNYILKIPKEKIEYVIRNTDLSPQGSGKDSILIGCLKSNNNNSLNISIELWDYLIKNSELNFNTVEHSYTALMLALGAAEESHLNLNEELWRFLKENTDERLNKKYFEDTYKNIKGGIISKILQRFEVGVINGLINNINDGNPLDVPMDVNLYVFEVAKEMNKDNFGFITKDGVLCNEFMDHYMLTAKEFKNISGIVSNIKNNNTKSKV
jgi:hypothetical protein